MNNWIIKHILGAPELACFRLIDGIASYLTLTGGEQRGNVL